jgi:hypothetical protein
MLTYSTSTVQIPNWNLKIDYVEACNCDYGCPCNFNGFHIRLLQALVLYHIRNRSYGDIKLDGIDVI